jgi:hypothetical protein
MYRRRRRKESHHFQSFARKTVLGDGMAPANGRMRADFPYFGEPYAATQQAVSSAGLRKEIGRLRPFFGTQSSQKFNCDINLLF